MQPLPQLGLSVSFILFLVSLFPINFKDLCASQILNVENLQEFVGSRGKGPGKGSGGKGSTLNGHHFECCNGITGALSAACEADRRVAAKAIRCTSLLLGQRSQPQERKTGISVVDNQQQSAYLKFQ